MPAKKKQTVTLPPDPDGQNDERAADAYAALVVFMDKTGTERCDAVADLLTNLKHWCDRNGYSFLAELQRANSFYQQETESEPWRLKNQ